MKFNENKEARINWNEVENHFKEVEEKIESLSLTIEAISDLEKVNQIFEGRKIDKWEIGLGKKGGGNHAQTMVLDFKLKAKEIDKVLDWLKTEQPELTWCLWEKWGDPLIYWKREEKKLYRYYWLGQKIGKLRHNK